MQIAVSVVEDDNELRESVSELIGHTDNLRLSGLHSSAEDFRKSVDSIMPDVVLMDLQLPGESGIDCIRKLKPQYPGLHFLVYTVFEDAEKVFNALCAGASGYLLKNCSTDSVLQSIVDIYNGGSPMSSTIARKVVDSFQKNVKNDFNLSKRENEILLLLSQGFRYKEIADKLDISIQTVRVHIRNIYEKLQVQSRTEAINKAFPR